MAPHSDRKTMLGATQNIFATTAASMLSDINKKVTSWDKNAYLDPSLTQRVAGQHASIVPRTME